MDIGSTTGTTGSFIGFGMILVIPCGGGQPARKETPGSFHHIEEEEKEDDGCGYRKYTLMNVLLFRNKYFLNGQATILLHRIVRYY